LDHSVKLEVAGETVQATLSGSRLWSFPIAALVLIGEYTTNQGPYVDDYFVEFVTVESGKPFFWKVSFYAEGVEQSFVVLEKKLGEQLLLELYASTEWKSRVVWPPAESGKPFLRPAKSTSTFKAFMERLALRGPDQVVSDEVKAYIAKQVANPGNIRRHE